MADAVALHERRVVLQGELQPPYLGGGLYGDRDIKRLARRHRAGRRSDAKVSVGGKRRRGPRSGAGTRRPRRPGRGAGTRRPRRPRRGGGNRIGRPGRPRSKRRSRRRRATLPDGELAVYSGHCHAQGIAGRGRPRQHCLDQVQLRCAARPRPRLTVYAGGQPLSGRAVLVGTQEYNRRDVLHQSEGVADRAAHEESSAAVGNGPVMQERAFADALALHESGVVAQRELQPPYLHTGLDGDRHIKRLARRHGAGRRRDGKVGVGGRGERRPHGRRRERRAWCQPPGNRRRGRGGCGGWRRRQRFLVLPDPGHVELRARPAGQRHTEWRHTHQAEEPPEGEEDADQREMLTGRHRDLLVSAGAAWRRTRASPPGREDLGISRWT